MNLNDKQADTYWTLMQRFADDVVKEDPTMHGLRVAQILIVNKIAAIKLVRQLYSLGLKEAKDAVEAYVPAAAKLLIAGCWEPKPFQEEFNRIMAPAISNTLATLKQERDEYAKQVVYLRDELERVLRNGAGTGRSF